MIPFLFPSSIAGISRPAVSEHFGSLGIAVRLSGVGGRQQPISQHAATARNEEGF